MLQSLSIGRGSDKGSDRCCNCKLQMSSRSATVIRFSPKAYRNCRTLPSSLAYGCVNRSIVSLALAVTAIGLQETDLPLSIRKLRIADKRFLMLIAARD